MTKPRIYRQAVLDLEARQLARAVATYGVLGERQLFDLSGAHHWARGSFERACRIGVERGLLNDLGLGFYGPPHEDAPQPAPRRRRLTLRRR